MLSAADFKDIIDKAEDYFYFEDVLSSKLEAWAADRCSTFGSADEEHPLSHQQAHTEFCQFFESLMEGFLADQDISLQQFCSAVRLQMSGPNSKASFSSVLLSIIDFEAFCVLMRDVNEGRGIIFCPPLVDIDHAADEKERYSSWDEKDSAKMSSKNLK